MFLAERVTTDVLAVLEQEIAKENIAGANALIRQNGKDFAYVEAGYADVANKKPIKRDTIFRAYSMSKPITSAAVMKLVERGQISLSEPVWKYLPGFIDQKIVTKEGSQVVRRPALIKDLLSMTSGLPYGWAEGGPVEVAVQELFDEIDQKLYTDEALGTVEIANRLGEIGVCFQPGDSWQYGTSADILGAVVEVVSGVKYGEFLEEELFKPLGMIDTGFWVPEEKKHRLAQAYERRNGKLELFETNHLGIKYTREEGPAFESGGAGLSTTIDDYAHFAQMLLDSGKYNNKEVLAPGTVAFMTSRKLTPTQQERFWYDWDNHQGYSYGCLMQHMIEPQMSYYPTWLDEYGWDGWLGTYFMNSPHNKITILLGMQVSNPEGNLVFEKVRDVVAKFM